MDRRIVSLGLAVALLIAFVWYLQHRTDTPPPALAEAEPAATAGELPGAVLLDGLGDFHHPITANAEAQRWFDQGLILTYGFNHDAAERSYLMGTQADPDCAMCWWGAALVLGPHVNAGMDPTTNAKAWHRLQKAQALVSKVSEREQAYIRALAARYAETPPQDRRTLDEAWAAAMGELAQQYPDDNDALTMYAEALMDLQPWDYYDESGQPKGSTGTFVSTLETVMARAPDHPGALHLYIHAVEASNAPQRGAVAADRLRELVPGAGHLVHMPGHIYARVGRYHDAMIANRKAIAADDAYLSTCKPAPGIYPLGYVPHNHHFLWFAASMAGDRATALSAAAETGKRADIPELLQAPGYSALQHYWLTPLFADVRFGRWDEIAARPRPSDEMPYVLAMWRYAQGMAAIRQSRLDDARTHAEALAAMAADPQFEQMMVWDRYPLSLGLRIAERTLAGELAAAGQDHVAAIAALEQAVEMDDQLPYDEPPAWHYPVRHSLGAVLLDAGRAADAEAIYREDLRRNPENGWALYGLAQSLRRQQRDAEADEIEQRWQQAWAHADIELTASRL